MMGIYEMKVEIKKHDKVIKDDANKAYMRYWQRLHRLRDDESIMFLSRTEYIYYYILWNETRDIFSQLKKKPEHRRTQGAIHFTSSACRFITSPLI